MNEEMNEEIKELPTTRHVLHSRKSVNSVRFNSQGRETIAMHVVDDWLIVYMTESTASEVLDQLMLAVSEVKCQRLAREKIDD